MGYVLVFCLILFLDLFSKFLINKHLPENEKKYVLNGKLTLHHIKNKGIAYNTFERSPRFVTAINFSAVFILIFIIFKSFKNKENVFEKIGYTFLLGGAVGNLIDRIKNKGVTDFIFVKKIKTTIFNIADVFIAIGALMVLLVNLLKK